MWTRMVDYINDRGKWKELSTLDIPNSEDSLIKELEDLICNSLLPMPNQKDEVVWDRRTNGQFLIKFSYHLIFENDQITISWKKIWISQLLLKVNFFWWTVMHGKILTTDNLQRQGSSITNICYLC